MECSAAQRLLQIRLVYVRPTRTTQRWSAAHSHCCHPFVPPSSWATTNEAYQIHSPSGSVTRYKWRELSGRPQTLQRVTTIGRPRQCTREPFGAHWSGRARSERNPCHLPLELQSIGESEKVRGPLDSCLAVDEHKMRPDLM
jgi:hypothetical protein